MATPHPNSFARGLKGASSMADLPDTDKDKQALVYRQRLWKRITHWPWAIPLFWLWLACLQIFNAHLALYVGQQSGFGLNNEVLAFGADSAANGQPAGYSRVL